MPVNLPTNLLRSFVAIVDTGSMLNASEQVFVTQSALSLQVKRLEELVQQALFIRDGRRLTLTPAGDLLLDYARRVLILHDEAVAAVSNNHFSGPVRIGMVQDFADTLLTGLLSTFARLHPDTQIYARVAGTAELQTLLERRQLDVILGFASGSDSNAIATAPMQWYGSRELTRRNIVPLAVIEQPCRFREAAIRTLDAAEIPYRIAVETPNLSTLKAAVQAGLAVTCRTHLFLHDLDPLEDGHLPTLPPISCVVETAETLDAPAQKLADLTRRIVREL
ncbi:LysR substrate-binding domain-containing protein [Asticcacaulis sp. BYS171W]|uniref:LysR substrate-binding domain-containing protein n=1 Tax=Asticcacaulis aquaticus TaxID=2984212 RepID=A0ABT5HUK1_9CAUL|nr:LysR substrate-binding domain-containing protein [Asticcacaulis aquaticus]MDC7683757.1 LysR substrate-binding domain-containing protein [Asticcacaulis aquaticus]